LLIDLINTAYLSESMLYQAPSSLKAVIAGSIFAQIKVAFLILKTQWVTDGFGQFADVAV
jgi:hypothetical protein